MPNICNLDDFLSNSSKSMKRSAIRELLKVSMNSDIISFAGGFPAPETFPVEELQDIVCESLAKHGNLMLQYGATEGDNRLRDLLIKRYMKQTGIKGLNLDNLVVVSSSQQALDAVGKILINPGDTIIVESPSYIGGLGAFKSYGATIISVELENDGIHIEKLEQTIKSIYSKGKTIKFIYLIPDFQNPAGVTTCREKRRKIIDLANKFNFIIIEDSPYRELRYTGKEEPPFFKLDDSHRVLSLFTFSKIFCPGFRLGWLIAPTQFIDKIVVAKQSMDLCSSAFTQAITAEYISRGLLEKRVINNIELYSKRRETMLKALEKYMPKHKQISWTKPEGGLFLWVTLPESCNTDTLFNKALEAKVAYVIGSAFYSDIVKYNSFRMNFSFPNEKEIIEGVKRLSAVIKEAV